MIHAGQMCNYALTAPKAPNQKQREQPVGEGAREYRFHRCVVLAVHIRIIIWIQIGVVNFECDHRASTHARKPPVQTAHNLGYPRFPIHEAGCHGVKEVKHAALAFQQRADGRTHHGTCFNPASSHWHTQDDVLD